MVRVARVKGAILVDTDRCKGCEVCVANCPFDVLEMSKEVNAKGYAYAYMLHPDQCTGCAGCALVCPDGCIRVYKMKEQR